MEERKLRKKSFVLSQVCTSFIVVMITRHKPLYYRLCVTLHRCRDRPAIPGVGNVRHRVAALFAFGVPTACESSR